MLSGKVVLRDGRGSPRVVRIGSVSVFRRAASWHIYYRENGRQRRIRIGPDRRDAELRPCTAGRGGENVAGRGDSLTD